MRFKKIKRQCGVRGCHNIVSYALSRNRELGNSVIICRECLEEALKEIAKSETQKENPDKDTENAVKSKTAGKKQAKNG